MTRKIIAWSVCLFLLIGVTSSGNSDILCIGDDGHIELETICLPCCTEVVELCDTEEVDIQHEEHNECTNCSDVEIDNPLWSKRFQKINTSQYLKTIHVSIIAFPSSLNHSSHTNLQFIYNQNFNPPNLSLSSTILIC